ncbi:hypothetical protein RF11_05641 [Thelohanellus kitauei]|uniref:Uncharacterized protein n=1 Tax=Thelohanellus kitauei TaxID=669202 RepID=A0A0C2MTW7_THEKT|nr:hypothetical protein RF11_05641 [Thelohanellus kitauei]
MDGISGLLVSFQYDNTSFIYIHCKLSDFGIVIHIGGCVVATTYHAHLMHNHIIGYIYKFKKNTKYQFSNFNFDLNIDKTDGKYLKFQLNSISIDFVNSTEICEFNDTLPIRYVDSNKNYLLSFCEQNDSQYRIQPEISGPKIPIKTKLNTSSTGNITSKYWLINIVIILFLLMVVLICFKARRWINCSQNIKKLFCKILEYC